MKDTQALKKFLTEFEFSALPKLKEGKHISLTISAAMAEDPILKDLLEISGNHGSFVGLTVNIGKDTSVQAYEA